MKISVVTIAFNEEKNIRRTIESVLNQTSNDFEYILCDGKSTDKTVEIANSYIDAFEKKGISFQIWSEKDKGIYDAMNKGIEHSKGEYVHFLNAGDWYFDSNVISNVVEKILETNSPDVIYGDIVYVERGVVLRQSTDHNNLARGMTMAHPSTFVANHILKEKFFDIQYKIAADYNLLLELYLEKKSFSNIHIPISYFELDGVSATNVSESLKEQRNVLISHGQPATRPEDEQSARKAARIRRIKYMLPEIIWKWWCIKVKKKEML